MKSGLTHRITSVFLALFLVGFAVVPAFAQNDHMLRVLDRDGNPLSGVRVSVGKTYVYNTTDSEGIVIFKADKNETVKIVKDGYEPILLTSDRLPSEIHLQETVLFKGAGDDVHYPFLTYKKRHTATGEYVISGEELKSYPTNDLRNALVGLIPGLDVVEKNGSPTFSVMEQATSESISNKVGMNLRGYSPIFIIDGLEVDITEIPLDPDEIESITVIKDIVAKTMYGPRAGNGIINVVTKRGQANVREVHASVESGISMTDRFPEWVSGADYARLNNLARKNSGMDPLYTDDDIAQYGRNDAYDLFHPSINYRDMLWKDNRSLTRANVYSKGGNDWVKYFAYLGFNNEGDNFKIGPKADNNRITARSNLDINVTKEFTVSLGIYAGLTIRNAPNYGSSASSEEMNDILSDFTTLPPIAFPVYARIEDVETPWYGVSSTYSRNPVGDLTACGYFKEQTRSGAANIALDYDFSRFVTGLKSRSFFTFNLLNMTRIGKDNDYPAYIVTPTVDETGATVPAYSKVRDGVDNSAQTKFSDYYYQRLAFNQKISYDRTLGDHGMQFALIYSLFNGTKDSRREPERQQYGIFTGMYSYKDKYSVEGVLNYAGSASFPEGKRYNLFYAAGLGWVVSEEPFMKDVRFIDYLKLRVNAGVLGYDGLSTAFYYQDRWSTASATSFGPHSANQWFGSNTESVSETYPNRISNDNLTWEKRKEFSAGMDALLLDRKLYFEVSYYDNLQDGVIAKMSNMLPDLTGYSSASPWVNYNTFRYYGAEIALSYSGKVNDFRYKFGGNITLRNTRVLKYDEPNYREAYRSMIGHSKDAIAGYTYIGKYSSDAEAQAVDQSFDETLHAGDLKYEDLNKDGVLDANDVSYIGNSSPRVVYGVQLGLGYKNFDVKLVGSGRAAYDIAMTNIYFRNGTGDNTYSKFVMDNMDGAYPRLTYQKVNNNFLTSAYWLEKGDFFKLQNVELSYTLPLRKIKSMDYIRFLVRGANLLTISSVKDVDPESVNAGVTAYPLCKTFTAGLEFSF